MMNVFRLSLEKLEHGWADLSLLFNEQEVFFYFEYVPNDALYDLILSAIRITGGIESSVLFHNGSQTERLTIQKLENQYCRVATEQFSADLSVKQFCRAVLRMFDGYTHTFSEEEYAASWCHFPEEDLKQLRGLYHSLKNKF